MIDEKSLNKCIDNLAEINAHLTNSALKRLVLEVGYVLKQELDNVSTWNKQFQGDNRLRGFQVDTKKLVEDNTQLFNENRKLLEINAKLKQVIDEKIPQVENAVNNINHKINTFSDILLKS